MKYIALVVSFYFSCIVFGQVQVTINNNSLFKPSANVAYRNYANDLQLVGIEINETTTIMSGDEKINRFDDLFVYVPMKSITSDTLMILHNGEQVGEVVMKIEVLKAPKVFFGEIKDNKVSMDYLLSNPGLHISYEPQYALPNLYVSNALLILKQKGKKDVQVVINGNAFSPKQIKRLSKLKSGDSLYFKEAILSDFLGSNDLIEANLTLVIE